MSIIEMMKEHPDAGNGYDEALGQAIRHAMYCAAICNSCADACSGEEMEMRRCIRLCADCADICTAFYRVASRQTSDNRATVRGMLEACIIACRVCAEECEQHDNPHCRRCATMCRECLEDCEKALATLA